MLDSRYLRPSTLESSAPRQFQRQRPKLLPAACRLALSLPLVNSLGRGSKNMTCICGMRRIPVFVYPAECGAITRADGATCRVGHPGSRKSNSTHGDTLLPRMTLHMR